MTIHRDLKPDNIGFDQVSSHGPPTRPPHGRPLTTHPPAHVRIAQAGNLKLFDFGLAAQVPRQVEEEDEMGGAGGGGRRLPRYRLTGQTGSVRYMAPEVSR